MTDHLYTPVKVQIITLCKCEPCPTLLHNDMYQMTLTYLCGVISQVQMSEVSTKLFNIWN